MRFYLQVDSFVCCLPDCLLKPGEEFAELARRLWPLTILQPVEK